jgi:hypothetical protein
MAAGKVLPGSGAAYRNALLPRTLVVPFLQCVEPRQAFSEGDNGIVVSRQDDVLSAIHCLGKSA